MIFTFFMRKLYLHEAFEPPRFFSENEKSRPLCP